MLNFDWLTATSGILITNKSVKCHWFRFREYNSFIENALLHHRLDADIPSRGIKRIAYVNAYIRAESLTLTSSLSCICGNVTHSLHWKNSVAERTIFWSSYPENIAIRPMLRYGPQNYTSIGETAILVFLMSYCSAKDTSSLIWQSPIS